MGAEAERVRVDGGWKWRARILLEVVIGDVIMIAGGLRVLHGRYYHRHSPLGYDGDDMQCQQMSQLAALC